MTKLCDMNEEELKSFLDEVQDEIDDCVELNRIASDLVKLVDKKNQIEIELDRRLKYIESHLK